MDGGIRAWEGGVAEGAPESGMAYFAAAERPEELIALAWALEEGSRRFYSGVRSFVSDEETKRLFRDLSTAEEHHKASLERLYNSFSGGQAVEDFHGTFAAAGAAGDIMEGGMRLSEALAWAKDKEAEAVFELALALETNAYDLYIRMRHQMKEDKTRQVFDQLSKEEKKHLELLAALFEKKM